MPVQHLYSVSSVPFGYPRCRAVCGVPRLSILSFVRLYQFYPVRRVTVPDALPPPVAAYLPPSDRRHRALRRCHSACGLLQPAVHLAPAFP